MEIKCSYRYWLIWRRVVDSKRNLGELPMPYSTYKECRKTLSRPVPSNFVNLPFSLEASYQYVAESGEVYPFYIIKYGKLTYATVKLDKMEKRPFTKPLKRIWK